MRSVCGEVSSALHMLEAPNSEGLGTGRVVLAHDVARSQPPWLRSGRMAEVRFARDGACAGRCFGTPAVSPWEAPSAACSLASVSQLLCLCQRLTAKVSPKAETFELKAKRQHRQTLQYGSCEFPSCRWVVKLRRRARLDCWFMKA